MDTCNCHKFHLRKGKDLSLRTKAHLQKNINAFPGEQATIEKKD